MESGNMKTGCFKDWEGEKEMSVNTINWLPTSPAHSSNRENKNIKKNYKSSSNNLV